MRRLLFHIRSWRAVTGFFISGGAFLFLYVHASGFGPDRVGVFFGGVANLASVSAGFVGAFYFFTAARSTAFLQKIEKSRLFSDLLLLIRFSFILSLLLIFLCLRNMVFSPIFNFSDIADNFFSLVTIILAGVFFGLLWECMALFRQLTE
jgi:hypothetical protein